jgi:dephospho-CoA kinase
MLKIALTGAMGSGKSTLANILKSYGAYIADVDDILRTLLQDNDPVTNILLSEFGPDFIQDGQINVGLMYEFFSRDPLLHDRFHSIIHPFIERAATKLYKEVQISNFKYFVLVAPHIVEERSSLHRKFDFVVSVDSLKENKIDRLIKRTNFNRKTLLDFLELDSLSQHRKLQADLIVKNDGDLKNLTILANQMHTSILKLNTSNKLFNLKKIVLSLVFFTGFSGSLSHAACITTLPFTCDSTISQSSNSKIYGGLKWTFGESFKPEAILGIRHFKVDSTGDTDGADLSISATLVNGLELGKLRAKYFNGNDDVQGEVGGGFDFNKGFFTGIGVHAPYSNLGIDLIPYAKDRVEPYLQLDTIKGNRKPPYIDPPI